YNFKIKFLCGFKLNGFRPAFYSIYRNFVGDCFIINKDFLAYFPRTWLPWNRFKSIGKIIFMVKWPYVDSLGALPHQSFIVVGTFKVKLDFLFPLFRRNAVKFGKTN